MTLVGVDDTDSRSRGMCTTYLGARLAARLDADRAALVRLAPAVERKTRGNAAVAIETDAPPARARRVAVGLIDRLAATADPNTSPGLAVTGTAELPDTSVAFTRQAVRSVVSIERAATAARAADCRTVGWDGDRRVETDPGGSWNESDVVGWGRIGAVAAVGAFRAFDDDTYERLVYRPASRWGTDREVDAASVFAAAREAYPAAWDTIDATAEHPVCVPHTPGPVLFGIRGDDRETVESVAAAIDHEPAELAHTFVTNQGTDAHLLDGEIGELTDGRAYRVDGVVVAPPETREGGHVFCTLAHPDDVASGVTPPERSGGVHAPTTGETTRRLTCVAFEPTKWFRDRVRGLRAGDCVTACGEVTDDTCKLEKFAVTGLVRWTQTNPSCPACDRSMSSAGRNQGYRCRDCDTHADEPAWVRLDRELARGWYEVPPVARRHIAKPLVRGGFDGATHPER